MGYMDRGRAFHEYDAGCTGTEDGIKKGKAPKGYDTLSHIAWVRREECRNCHRRMGSYLIYTELCIY